MGESLRLLIVEDSENDAILIAQELRHDGYDITFERMETPATFNAALDEQSWDIIIADYTLPRFSGLDALQLLQEKEKDIPFIVVSGTIGEDVAVTTMKAGAHDYVLKDNLTRLGPAVRRELHEAEMRLARRQAEKALQESEEKYRHLVERANDGIVIVQDGIFKYANPRSGEILDCTVDEIIGQPLTAYVDPDEIPLIEEHYAQHMAGEDVSSVYETVLRQKDGSKVFVELNADLVTYQGQSADLVIIRDITERMQAQETLALKMEQLAALSQASQAVTASLDLDQVLTEIVALAGEVAASDYTSVVLVDEAGDIGQSVEDLSGVPSLEYRIRRDGLTNWIVRSRQPVIIDEIGDEGIIHPDLGHEAPRLVNPFIVKANIRSLAGLPLMVQERLLGVLYLHSLRPEAFHDRLSLLTAFANQVTIAIENARLFQVEKQQKKRLSLMTDVSRLVAAALDADDLLQAVAENIHHKFGYPAVAFLTLDKTGLALDLRAYSGLPTETISLPRGSYSQSIDEGIIGRVARTGESYLVPDVDADPYYSPSDRKDIHSALGIPIADEGSVIGVIYVESDRLADFGKEERSLLETVADTVTVGLRNIRLYEEAQHRVRELIFLNSISARLGEALNLDTLIDEALEGLHRLVEADRTHFITVDPDAHTWEITHEQVAPDLKMGIGLSGAFGDIPVIIESLLNDQPFAVLDVAVDPRIEAVREEYLSLGIQSILMVPVQMGNQLCGILSFDYCRERHAWNLNEIRLLEGMAHQLELALDNLHLFEEVQTHADELTTALAQLEEIDQLKNEFIQNASHELRSPLTLIRGYIDMLATEEMGELQPQQQKAVSIIARRARILGELIQDLTLALEVEASPPRPKAVPLAELARVAVEDFQVAAKEAKLTLCAEIASSAPPVKGSLTYLRRVLDNLIGNAIKFTPRGGTITVRLQQQDSQVALEVSDTGIGIPADQLEHIFERFYQVDGSARRRYGGVGLGLALVKEIAETYGGEVKVESQVGEGSTFSVLLPIAVDRDIESE